MKKIRIFAAVLSLICLCSCKSGNENAVAYVNGEAIENREFMMMASRKKAEIFKYFTDKYGAQYSEDFWETSFEGEKPSEVITKLVMEELAPIKIQQKMAVEYDILNSCNYSDFLNRLEKENNERKQKKENNEIVYGVSEYTEETYYSDELAKTIISLKEAWKKKLDFSDKELKEFYQQIRDTYYRQKPTGEITLYIFDYESFEIAEGVLEKAKSGQEFEQEVETAGGRKESLVIDENLSERYYDLQYPGLLQELDEKYSSLLSLGDEVYFAQTDKITTKYKKYEDVKSNVEKLYVDKLYNEYIKKEVKEAKIDLISEKLDFSDI